MYRSDVAVRCFVLKYVNLSGNLLLRLGQLFPLSNLRNCDFISDSGLKKVGYWLYFLT